MKAKIILLALLIAVFCSCEGKRGPVGPEGDAGKSLEIVTYEGILTAFDVSEDCWTFTFNIPLENCIVTVFVRKSGQYLWWEPQWYMNDYTIYIADDDRADRGYEYRITIAY